MKILYVATVQSHIAQFHLKAISMMKEKGYEIHVAARNNLNEKNGLKLENVDKIFDVPFERDPFKVKNIKAYGYLKQIMNQEKYDIIHCNTPVGGILARLAANRQRKRGTMVIYTAHGFHFYKGAPLLNWLIYYPVEKIMAGLTSKLITITEEDYLFAKKKFRCPVYRIHGVGANSEKYGEIDKQAVAAIKNKLQLDGKFVILCTGELNKNKNQKTVIKAMGKIVRKLPETKLLLAGNGPEKENLEQQIYEEHLQDNIILLGYVTELENYVYIADLIVSASFREGLPLNIVEAMYSGKPVVTSKNRGHKELVEDGVNGYLVSADDSEAFSDKIIRLGKDPALCAKFGERGREKSEKYMDRYVLKELKTIYEI